MRLKVQPFDKNVQFCKLDIEGSNRYRIIDI